MKPILILLVLTGLHFSAVCQSTLTSTQAYEYLQLQRQRADEAVGEGAHPSPDSIRKAITILTNALTYYDRPDVQTLAQTNIYLKARKPDILRDLALYQARAGNVAESVNYVKQSADLSGTGDWIMPTLEKDSTFRAVTQDPTYVALKKKLGAMNRVFNSDALKTPYRPNISEDEKIAGLSKLWSEAKYNFAYFDHLPDLDWDKLYLDYLAKVRATPSTVAYMQVLEEFCAQLHDGHTDVWTTDPVLSDSVSRRPPIRTVLVADKVLVQQVLSDSLLATGIRPGLELVSIDGVPTRTYADRYVRPRQSGSTPQNIDVNTYVYDLLRGPVNKPVALTFRTAAGQSFERVLPRTGYANLKPVPAFRFQLLPGNVAYVQLNNFENNQALNRFKAAFDSIAATQALIIDLRQNGGGNSNYGYSILTFLTNKPILTGSYASRIYSPVRRARGEAVQFEEVDRQNSGDQTANKQQYTKPVIVLTGGQTFSAAEDFVVAFDFLKRGILVGEPTGGSTGQPLSFALPGGLMARVCTKRDMYPDGTEWVGKGIQPNVLVHPTVADLQAGRDTVLEAALKQFGSSAPTDNVLRRTTARKP